jgi:RNA recognition motif-containing protein
MSSQTLRETLRNIFLDFKKSSHLLNIKIIDDYALLTFRKSEDVDKALLFITTKSINGIRLKAELYDGLIPGKSNIQMLFRNLFYLENDEYDLLKRSISSDLDLDEYSIKATRTLYIGNLPAEISYQELREIYSAYGEIIVRIKYEAYLVNKCFALRKLKSNDNNFSIHRYSHLFNIRISKVLLKS